MRKAKKPNKKQRDERRAHDADIFNEAFSMGYQMGYTQGATDKEEEVMKLLHRERVKALGFGR